jgi:GNAT superfamily N-acetyltransferase
MTYLPTAADFNELFRGKIYGNYDIFTARTYADFVRRHDIDLSRAISRFDDDGLLGTIVFALRGDRAWLALMGVRETMRGNGFGRELLCAALERLRGSGMRSIEFEIVQRNTPALTMVRSLGFAPVDELYVWARRPKRGAAGVLRMRTFTENAVQRIARTPATCWQREPRSVAAARNVALIECEGAYAFVRISGENAVILDAGAADAGAAARLAEALDARIPHDLTLLNEPAGSPLSEGLARSGWRVVERQHRIAGA